MCFKASTGHFIWAQYKRAKSPLTQSSASALPAIIWRAEDAQQREIAAGESPPL